MDDVTPGELLYAMKVARNRARLLGWSGDAEGVVGLALATATLPDGWDRLPFIAKVVNRTVTDEARGERCPQRGGLMNREPVPLEALAVRRPEADAADHDAADRLMRGLTPAQAEAVAAVVLKNVRVCDAARLAGLGPKAFERLLKSGLAAVRANARADAALADEARHRDLTDDEWSRVAPLFDRPPARTGRRPGCKRALLDGVLYQVRTGRRGDTPRRVGHPKTLWQWRKRWTESGVLARVLETLSPPEPTS